jgi:hypothetical protein
VDAQGRITEPSVARAVEDAVRALVAAHPDG